MSADDWVGVIFFFLLFFGGGIAAFGHRLLDVLASSKAKKTLEKENKRLHALLTAGRGEQLQGIPGADVYADRQRLLYLLLQVKAQNDALPQLGQALSDEIDSTLKRMLPPEKDDKKK